MCHIFEMQTVGGTDMFFFVEKADARVLVVIQGPGRFAGEAATQ